MDNPTPMPPVQRAARLAYYRELHRESLRIGDSQSVAVAERMIGILVKMEDDEREPDT